MFVVVLKTSLTGKTCSVQAVVLTERSGTVCVRLCVYLCVCARAREAAFSSAGLYVYLWAVFSVSSHQSVSDVVKMTATEHTLP